MKRPIALLASLLAVTVLATAATAAGGDASDPLISLNYLQTTFTTKANSSIDAALDKSDQAAYAKAEAALRSTIAAAEANVGAQRADVLPSRASSREMCSPAQQGFRSSCWRAASMCSFPPARSST